MPLSRAGSRIAGGAVIGAGLALAFAAFAVVITWVVLRLSSEALAPARVATTRTAQSWPNAPGVTSADAGSPRQPMVETPAPDAIAEPVTGSEAAVDEAVALDEDEDEGVAGAAGAAPSSEEESSLVAETAGGVEPAPPIESPAMCGGLACPRGMVCCNASCGICAPPGEKCSQIVCGMSSPLAMSVMCGQNTCNVGDVCCNATCGICTKPGAYCDPRPCPNPPVIPFSETCGLATCNVGMVCCNPSCGICAKPGDPCRQEPC